MDNFLADTVIIPPGEWDKNVLSQTIPSLADQTKKTAVRRRGAILKRKRGALTNEPAVQPEKEVLEIEEDTLSRTGRFCGGLVRDVKRRFSMYRSDITDSYNWRCLFATILVYLACLAPAISFGGLLYEYTDGWMGVAEMIVSTALSGIIFALFAGQPLIIIGATGPLLVFEKNTYDLCMQFGIEYLPWRAWVGIWVMVICFGIVACEGCFLIRYFTRFTEEIFACLISLIFIYDGFYYIYNIYQRYPLSSNQGDTVNGNTSNTALLTTILFFGTFFLASTIRQIRHSHFFGHAARRILSDFGVLIAIVAMGAIGMFTAAKVFVPKLMVPDGFAVTSPSKRGWFVNPMGDTRSITAVHIFSALIPAILVSILVFMEVEFCNVILDKKDHKLKKGPGYNLDLFVVGLLVGLDSILGLPWMCATPVHTVSHFHALMVLSSNHAPGEHAQLEEVKEQRVTNIVIHVLIGLTVFLSTVLRLIPVAVLFGVFVYLGISSLSHLQVCDRFKLLMIPTNHHPDKRYVRNVPTLKMHCFTVLQAVLIAFLVAIKITVLAPAFPFFIICLIPLRRTLERFYSEAELEELDNEDEEGYDSDMDDFDSVHVPI